jgi:hypothetical protein
MEILAFEGSGVIGSTRMKDLPEFSGWFGPEKIRFDSFLDRGSVFLPFGAAVAGQRRNGV